MCQTIFLLRLLSASVARGESRFRDDVLEFRDDVSEVGDSGCRNATSGGDVAGSRKEGIGENIEGDGDEFEGMVPDSVLFDEVDDVEPHVSLKNLWSEQLKCKLCDTARTFDWTSDKCELCGTWQGKILTREESEREAERLLGREGFISRCDLNHLLAVSLTEWKPSSRRCDREAASMGSSGLTLGLYVYGSKVGLTKSCMERPNLTKLLNRYLKQNTYQATWTALRVTCNFTASPHRDRNASGSLNYVAPISWFGEGKIWVEGEPPQDYKGPAVVKDFQGKEIQGHYIGGANSVAQFNPSKAHAVEPAVGNRRVVVAYSPRLLDRLSSEGINQLKELGFSVPDGAETASVPDQKATSKAKGGDRQEHGGGPLDPTTRKEGDPPADTGEEDHQVGFSPGGAGSNSGGWEIQERLDPEALDDVHSEFVRVRQLEIDCRKLLDEQLELAVGSGGDEALVGEESLVSHVMEMKAWVHDLERWLIKHDAISQLSDGMLGCEEAHVLTTRLCSMNLTCPAEEGEVSERGIEVPLSNEPLLNLQDGSWSQLQEAAEQWQAVPAGPLQGYRSVIRSSWIIWRSGDRRQWRS